MDILAENDPAAPQDTPHWGLGRADTLGTSVLSPPGWEGTIVVLAPQGKGLCITGPALYTGATGLPQPYSEQVQPQMCRLFFYLRVCGCTHTLFQFICTGGTWWMVSGSPCPDELFFPVCVFSSLAGVAQALPYTKLMMFWKSSSRLKHFCVFLLFPLSMYLWVCVFFFCLF